MDWFRRNWPDLVIGVALVAVVALIVVTLLSGGSLASLVRRDTPPDLITDTTGESGAPTTPSAAPGASPAAASAPATPSGAGENDIDVFVPGVPDDAANTGTGGQAGEDPNQAAGGLPSSTQPAQNASAGGSLPQATAAGGFRVAAGAVNSRSAAVDLAEGYRDSGLPVTIEPQDDLFLLWVGPYAARAQADRVAARIIEDGGDALVYSYDGPDTAATAGAAPSQPAAANAPAVNAPATATPEAAAPAASVPETSTAFAPAEASADGGADAAGQRYLQVGAFVSDSSAEPLRTQLEALGLNVSRTEDETGLVRLFVGPLGEAQLAQTQSRLSAEGIVGSFPVTR